MPSRRNFLQGLATAAGAFPFLSFSDPSFLQEAAGRLKNLNIRSTGEAITDEDFWAWIKEAYTVSPNIINLNNGGVSPQPKVVQDAHIRFYQYCNEAPSHFMWHILDQQREPLRAKLAELAGCSTEEIAINRNATEGLNTIIFGLNLKAGDEVVLTKQDYPNMINAWKQREKREGIKLVWLNLSLPMENEDELAHQYINAFTAKTKIVHVTHLVNWSGQIVPVKKIALEAHKRGIEVVCDGAHSFAHLNFKIPDLECDFFATSLHKWLCAPFGSGLVYIKKEKIKKIWALLSNNEPDGTDIRKFESLGTRSFASEMAIGNALDFHNLIGSGRKEERLRFLKDYWVNQVKDLPGVSFNQPKTAHLSCAIANIAIAGKTALQVNSFLYDKYKFMPLVLNGKILKVFVLPHMYIHP